MKICCKIDPISNKTWKIDWKSHSKMTCKSQILVKNSPKVWKNRWKFVKIDKILTKTRIKWRKKSAKIVEKWVKIRQNL